MFILSLGFYITPAVLGGGKVPLIANMMDLLINRFARWEIAAVVSVVLMAMTLSLYAIYQWLQGAPAMRRGGRLADAWLAAYAVAVLTFLCLPVLIVAPMSFSDAKSLEFPPPGLSLRWYENLFGNPIWIEAGQQLAGCSPPYRAPRRW